MTHPFRSRSLAVLVAVAVVWSATGCSDDASACDAARDLRASVDDLFSEETFEGGRDEVEASADQVRDDLGQLRNAAGDEFGDELDSLGQELDDLGSSVGDLEPGELSEGFEAVGDQADETRAAWDELVSEVRAEVEDCDLSE